MADISSIGTAPLRDRHDWHDLRRETALLTILAARTAAVIARLG
jgi:hypothetical protein